MRISFLTILLAGCATTTPMSTPKGGPRGLRASDHLDIAAQHDHLAHERSMWPEPSRMSPGSFDSAGQPVMGPWFRSWDTAADHEQVAAIERSKAAELDASYREACGTKPIEEVSVSPLVRYGVGGWPTTDGVIVYLSPGAGTPDELLAAMRCHRAFMMLAPSDMDDCPLDLPGLELDARGDVDGITVSMTVKDRSLVPELKRRAAHDLEASRRGGAPHVRSETVESAP